jgi:WXG100 family type VII secretion target
MAYTPSITSIQAHLPTLAESADYVRGAHNSLVTEHDNLKGFLNNLRGDWQGKGGTSWDDAQNRWDLAADGVYEVLWSLYVALANIHDNYSMTDDSLAKQWGG